MCDSLPSTTYICRNSVVFALANTRFTGVVAMVDRVGVATRHGCAASLMGVVTKPHARLLAANFTLTAGAVQVDSDANCPVPDARAGKFLQSMLTAWGGAFPHIANAANNSGRCHGPAVVVAHAVH